MILRIFIMFGLSIVFCFKHIGIGIDIGIDVGIDIGVGLGTGIAIGAACGTVGSICLGIGNETYIRRA